MKPKRLHKGDTVAVISPSWGGPGSFPKVFEEGLEILKDLGLKIKLFPFTTASAKEVYENPALRAKDIELAFLDSSVAMIITSIGGDDGVRVLEYIDPEIIYKNPKIFMGFSDTTVFTTYFNQLGLVTFNGPSVMAGLANLDLVKEEYLAYLNSFFFNEWNTMRCESFSVYAQNNTSWDSDLPLRLVNPVSPPPVTCLQGKGIVKGVLFGGCIEVLEFMKGTIYWPKDTFWKNKILFFETSEDKPSPDQVKYFLRNYGTQGILANVSGLVFGIARDYTSEENEELFSIIKMVLAEFDLNNLPVLVNLQFGHTYPQFILPLGITVELDCEKASLTLIENSFS